MHFTLMHLFLCAARHSATLDVAARGSNAKSDDNEILDRLHCQLLPGGNAELGWDVFTLRYSVDPPLTTVFNEWAMHRYLRIFNSLWRIKRVEYSLNSAWQRLKPNSVTRFSSLNRTPHERMLGTDLRRCHITRAEMSHVINNISYYMMFEVLESSWNTFRSAVASTHDLDSIIYAHENFLNDVLSAALLDESSEALKVRQQ
jgi:gamma-tubulin complex component 3